ncbi:MULTISPECIES: ArsS family sensor histidine kinase [unclassified Nitratiruptor]|uniref:ArsS family sensor histidine kinase n=1 Tax=unclassified Nitratiruptor TaxID=2624044 RepID=UPI0019158A5B|nr:MULTISPECIES: ArsS family sensor histidine kinase [unclassified Nitratiruptor]BCD60994.1 two-component system, OmpR family, sensor kinase [Nitratiruptor sp. YY08-10]BCD64926.1 two-component system, OmpR family, sensor kinase [Nitratiruptor sp. YY08-14]
MKKSSIFLWITLIFLLGFVAVGGAYWLSLQHLKESAQNRYQKRFEFVSQSLLWQLSSVDYNKLIQELQKLEFVPITHPKEIVKIAKHSTIIKRTKYPVGEVIILKYKGDYYIWVQSYGNMLLLKDISMDIQQSRILYTAIFAVTLILLLILYILIILKLRPLKSITKELQRFSKGDLDIDLNVEGFKEINEVANALQNAADSLKAIQNSRKLLLRNIMHELKTPIAKGRIQAEMVEDEKQKKRLIQIFEKLNSLINELAALEAVNSKIKPSLETITLKDIVEEAIHIGMFDKQDIEIIEKQNPTIKADYKLLAIAVKNLIDNALKYSLDAKATIVLTQDALIVQNRGKPLQKELSFYIEAFNKEGKRSGFGLGLYLVDNILKLHGYTLQYHYEDNHNKFIISLKPSH